MNAKPILFNTDMVRGLLDNRKTATRRVVKARHLRVLNSPYRQQHPKTPDKVLLEKLCEPPYRPGDILYVRETWCPFDADHVIDGVKYAYKADATPESERIRKEYGYKWRPSIHMPREAARIFLRVTDVRVERLQDITPLEILEKEGVEVEFPQPKPSYISLAYSKTRLEPAVKKAFADIWNTCYAKPRPIKGEDGTIDHYESYPWEDIQETRTYRGKPWYVIGNPWVWAIEFERISREEAMRRDS